MEKALRIKDFQEYYITDTGKAYSRVSSKYAPHAGRIKKLSLFKHKKGYMYVHLCKNGHTCNKSVHRLVAEAFIPNPDNKPEVNHKNGIRDDNRANNIEWCTHQENIIHSFKELGRKVIGSRKGKFGKDCPTSKIVQQIKDGVVIAEFYGSAEAHRITGLNQGHISFCCRGKKYKTVGGFQWKYKE